MNAPRVAAILALAGAVLAAGARAQGPGWQPDRPIELIASSGPGGSNDRTARTLQKILQEQKLVTAPISVVNKPGGNQTLARAYLNQHAGEPYYFDIGNPTLLSNPISGITQQQYRDFTPIALLLNEYTVFTVRADSPVRNMRDLAERLVKDPESFVIGVSNKGGTNHLTLGLVAKSAGVDPKRLKVVVFRSNAESLTAMLGGHIQMVASTVTSVIGQVSAGSARFIGYGAPRRMPGALATVPTLREQGFDISLSNWRAIMGAKGLAPEHVAFWEDALARAVAAEDWKRSLEAQYWEGHFLRSAEFQNYLAQQYELTRGIMADLGLAR